MKKILLFLPVFLLLFSCENDPVEALKNEKAKLESQSLENLKRIKEINKELLKLTGDEATLYPEVTIALAEKKFFEHKIAVQGLILADEMAQIVPEMGGLITSLPVKAKEGKMIQKGELIATFDTQLLSANMKELDEQIELAKYMFEKQESLFKQGVGTELQFKQAEGQYQALLQTKNTLSTQKGKYALTAPFTGYVEKVYVVQGSMAGPTTPIIMLVSPDKRKVVANISEVYLANLNEGAPVEVTVPALENQIIPDLKLNRVGKFVDPTNRTIAIEINIPKPTEKHIPNLMVAINVRDYADSAAIVIPSKVIMKDAQQQSFVFTLIKETEASKDSMEVYKVAKNVVKLGKSYNNETQILDGLTPGTIIVDRGKGDIYEGMLVNVVKK
jgi:membrane fusion protein, multidrug efflux system